MVKMSNCFAVQLHCLMACCLCHVSLGCGQDARMRAVVGRYNWCYTDTSAICEQYFVSVSDTLVRNGPYIEYYSDRKVARLLTFVENKLDGAYWHFRDDGTISEYGVYSHGQRTGLRCRYHRNGRIWQQAEFLGGKIWNIVHQFDSAGAELSCGDFKNGNGYAKIYREDGSIDEEGPYIDGLREGVWRKYGMQHSLMLEIVYRRGKAHWELGDSVEAVD